MRTLIDIEHSIFEISIEPNPNVKYLNDYEAWYRSRKQWIDLLTIHGFKKLPNKSAMRPSPTNYYYEIFLVE